MKVSDVVAVLTIAAVTTVVMVGWLLPRGVSAEGEVGGTVAFAMLGFRQSKVVVVPIESSTRSSRLTRALGSVLLRAR